MRKEMMEFWDGSGISRTICNLQLTPDNYNNTSLLIFISQMLSWCPTNRVKVLTVIEDRKEKMSCIY